MLAVVLLGFSFIGRWNQGGREAGSVTSPGHVIRGEFIKGVDAPPPPPPPRRLVVELARSYRRTGVCEGQLLGNGETKEERGAPSLSPSVSLSFLSSRPRSLMNLDSHERELTVTGGGWLRRLICIRRVIFVSETRKNLTNLADN